jgi:Fe/S biogenesis protein NfuA
MIPSITISAAAVAHCRGMLARQAEPGVQLRIYVLNPGTSLGHCGIGYWRPEAATAEDARLEFDGFSLYYASVQAPFLDGASADYRKTFSGYALSLQAPKAKQLVPVDADSPLAYRITHVLETQVNPHLSEHSGTVMLGEILDGGIITLKFGGGCQGCGHAEVTLRETVEKTLREHIPEIVAVQDETRHEEGTHPYAARAASAAA